MSKTSTADELLNFSDYDLTVFDLGPEDAFSTGMARSFRLLILSACSFLLLEACGKSSGFHAQTMNPMVAIQKTAEEKAQAQVIPTPGSVVRHSGKIQISQMGSPVDSSGVTTVKADVAVDGHALGQIEFKGTKKDSKIILEPVDPAYSQNLKATAFCLSDDCNQYFIDVFYKDKDVYYQDQFQTASVDEKVSAPTEVPNQTPVKAQSPPEKAKEKKEPKNPTPAMPPTFDAKKKTPAPVEPTIPDSPRDLIQDDIPVPAATEPLGFVGTSDDEAKALFEKAPVQEPAPQAAAQPAAQPEPETAKATPVKQAQTATPAPVVTPAKNPAPAPTPIAHPVVSPPAIKPTAPAQEKAPETNKDFPWTTRKDQAIGSSGAGKLRSPTDFFQLSKLPKVFFFIPQPGRTQFFGVLDLAQVLQKMGEYLQTILPGKRLAITDISKKFGGHLSPHQAHQNGTEADVRYIVRADESLPADVVVRGRVTNQLLIADQWKLFKKAFDLKQVEVIFVDAAVKKAMCEEAKRTQDLKTMSDQEGPTAEILKRLYPVGGHDTHFHVKVKCDHELCRRQPYLALPRTGC